MVEISGQERKIEAFIEAVRPYGILELARTGRIALVRGSRHLEDAQAFMAAYPGPGAGSIEDDPAVQGHSEL
jgi:acetolactate synthase-1/3 small subunit